MRTVATAHQDQETAIGLYGFPDGARAAGALASALGIPCQIAELHRFPDGESLVRLPRAFKQALLYRPLASVDITGRSDVRNMGGCNTKLMELLLAVSVLRENGAEHVTLVVPYLPYMRQDMAFRPGEPTSQKIIGGLLSQYFDRLITVEPHLHRITESTEIFPHCEVIISSAAPALAQALRTEKLSRDAVIIGADQQMEGCAREIATSLNLDWITGHKKRFQQRHVTIDLGDEVDLDGRDVVVVDDAISTGATLIECSRQAKEKGARSVQMLAVHALFSPEAANAFVQAGIDRVRSCDGVPHSSNAIPLAPLLARVLRPLYPTLLPS